MNRAQTKKRLQKGLESLLIGNRVPKEYFITSGVGESDIAVHAGSYHLALRDAGIERCNIMVYSSILPGIAYEVRKEKTLDRLVHGSVLESIMACSHSEKHKRATAGIIIGQLYDRRTKQRYGGLVAEYNEDGEENDAENSLRNSLDELYENGYSDRFGLNNIRCITRSFVPVKKHGTALVALCFVSYEFPILGYSGKNGKNGSENLF